MSEGAEIPQDMIEHLAKDSTPTPDIISTPLFTETIVGSFPPDKVDIIHATEEVNDEKVMRKTQIPSDVQVQIDRVWEEKIENIEQQNKEIDQYNANAPEEKKKNHINFFNGPAIRIVSAEEDLSRGNLVMEVERTDYKTFTGLKSKKVKSYIQQRLNSINEVIQNTQSYEAKSQVNQMKDKYESLLKFAKLSAACLIKTRDNHLMLQVRSDSVSQFPGWLGVAGGTAEPSHTSTNENQDDSTAQQGQESGESLDTISEVKFDPFTTVYSELNEEVGLDEEDIQDLRCTGFIRNGEEGYGVMVFNATTDLSKKEVEEIEAKRKKELKDSDQKDAPEGEAFFIDLNSPDLKNVIKKKVMPLLLTTVPETAGLITRSLQEVDPSTAEYYLQTLSRLYSTFKTLTKEQQEGVRRRQLDVFEKINAKA